MKDNCMSAQHSHSNYPKLHNAMWPGLVGKGSPGAEPCIDLDTMLDLTARAEVDGIKFDGVDLFLFDPHISIDIDDDDLIRQALEVVIVNIDADVRVKQEEIHTVELDAIHFGPRRQVEHGVQVNARFGAGAAFANQARPHGVVKLRVVAVTMFCAHKVVLLVSASRPCKRTSRQATSKCGGIAIDII